MRHPLGAPAVVVAVLAGTQAGCQVPGPSPGQWVYVSGSPADVGAAPPAASRLTPLRIPDAVPEDSTPH